MGSDWHADPAHRCFLYSQPLPDLPNTKQALAQVLTRICNPALGLSRSFVPCARWLAGCSGWLSEFYPPKRSAFGLYGSELSCFSRCYAMRECYGKEDGRESEQSNMAATLESLLCPSKEAHHACNQTKNGGEQSIKPLSVH